MYLKKKGIYERRSKEVCDKSGKRKENKNEKLLYMRDIIIEQKSVLKWFVHKRKETKLI